MQDSCNGRSHALRTLFRLIIAIMGILDLDTAGAGILDLDTAGVGILDLLRDYLPARAGLICLSEACRGRGGKYESNSGMLHASIADMT